MKSSVITRNPSQLDSELSITSSDYILGNETRANTYTTGNQRCPSADFLPNGDFVITWYGDGEGGTGDDIYVKIFDANGSAKTGDIRVNGYSSSNQRYPDITSLSNNDFVVTWTSDGQDGSGDGVYFKIFDKAFRF